MSQTLHDAVKEALIYEAIENCDWEIWKGTDVEKYCRMWKKITGKDISLEEAKIALGKAGE